MVKYRGIYLHPEDDVVTVTDDVHAGDVIEWSAGDAQFEMTVTSDVPRFHKLAVKSIAAGMPVIKYGQPIGISTSAIEKGDHVHIHNVRSVD